MTQQNLTQLLKVIRDLVMRNRPCYRDYIGNGQYETKLLPEYLLPAFLRKNVVASKTEVQSAAAKATDATNAANTAQTTADNAWNKALSAEVTAASANDSASNAATKAEAAQTTADEAKTTAVAAKNAADNVSNAVKPSRGTNSVCQYYMTNVYDESAPVKFYIGRLGYGMLQIDVDGTTPALKIIPPVSSIHQADFEFSRPTSSYPHPKIKGIGGIVMHSSTSGSTKQFLITVDDTGTLKATEVTS